jgi:hypothetical protein
MLNVGFPLSLSLSLSLSLPQRISYRRLVKLVEQEPREISEIFRQF